MRIQACAQGALEVGDCLVSIESAAHLARCPAIALAFILRLLLRALPLPGVDVNVSGLRLQGHLALGRRRRLRRARPRGGLLLLR